MSRLEGVSESKTRQRSMLRRLPGGEISAPADPPSHVIKEEWTKMVESGKLSLGIPCVPHHDHATELRYVFAEPFSQLHTADQMWNLGCLDVYI